RRAARVPWRRRAPPRDRARGRGRQRGAAPRPLRERARLMVLGLLPSIRGGLGELARTGQHARLIDGYFKPYARAFETVRYFSYLAESLDAYTVDAELIARVRLHPGGGWHPWAYSIVMPLRYAREFRRCAIFRVFQITGSLPAVIAKRRFGVPFVTTYGFWYGRLSRARASGALRRAVEALGLRAADAVIVTTSELGAHVAARIGAAKVHLIPNGVDTVRFAPAARSGRRAKNVLYVGRLSERRTSACSSKLRPGSPAASRSRSHSSAMARREAASR